MDRCKVICHMMVSIDGKIDGRYMDKPHSEEAGKYYEEIIFSIGTSMANGTNTNVLYDAHEEIDYTVYQDEDVPEGDFIMKEPEGHYLFSFDRNGRCNWNRNYFDYAGKRSRIVEVLTGKVCKEFRAHLQSLGVSYIIAGEDEMDMQLAAEKIRSLFGVENLVLCGGAGINGGFMKADLIDEISLVIAPYIEGNPSLKNCISTGEVFRNRAYKLKQSKPLEDGGVHLVFEKR